MRKFVELCVLILISTSCKKFSPLAEVKSEKQRATLFDNLIAQAPDGKVPYPFSKLVSHLSQYGKPVGILLPLGRSLQRKAGYPDPFKDPRRLVAFDPLPNLSGGLVEFDLEGRLFLGYVKQAKAIEVISLLPDRSEFDFQIISNYQADKTARIEYPDAEKQCKSCHQHGGPIFTPRPWEETNLAIIIRKLLQYSHSKEQIDGINIQQLSSESIIFDNLVRHGSELALNQNRWNNPCLQMTKVACRAQLFKSAVANSLSGVLGWTRMNRDFHSQTILPKLRPLYTHSIFIIDRAHHQYLFSRTNLVGYQPSAEAVELFKQLSVKMADADLITSEELQRKSPLELSDMIRELILEPDGESPPFSKAELVVAEFFVALAFVTTKPLRLGRLPSINISPQQKHIAVTELKKMLTYTHAHDSHLGTELDPQKKRGRYEDISTYNNFTRTTYRTRHILYKAMLIDSNRHRLTPDYKVLFDKLGVEVKTKYNSKTILFTTDLPPDVAGGLPSNLEIEKKISDCKTQGKHELRCNFSTDDLNGNTKSSSLKSFKFAFVGSSEIPAVKPGISRLKLVTKSGSTYEVDLRCDLVHFNEVEGDVKYGCFEFDIWKLFEAIDALAKDTDSFFHSPSLPQPVVVIKDILSQMGYNLQTQAEKIDWLKAINAHDASQEIYKPETFFGKKLVSYCGDCHALEFFVAPFLYAQTQAQLCDNVRYYKDQMLVQIEDELMPPADYLLKLQSNKLQQFKADRSHLLKILRRGDFDFCGD